LEKKAGSVAVLAYQGGEERGGAACAMYFPSVKTERKKKKGKRGKRDWSCAVHLPA